MMNGNKAFKEAFLFFGLTLGLSYLVFWGPLALFGVTAISFVSGERGPVWAIILYILGGFVPSGVALALTAIKEGRAGLRAIWKRILQVKIGWKWYLAAMGVVTLVTIAQISINRLQGNSFDLGLFLVQAGSILPLLFLGPLSEEIGWRGYALDRLQTRWNPLVSSLCLGLVWALWHAPLFAMPGTSQHELALPFLGFIVGLMAISVVYTWLHNQTGGSIWTAIFFHWVGTYAMQVVATGVTRSTLYNTLEYLPILLIAIVLVIFWKPWVKREPAIHE
jgi:membrane protease YdiL (CAAX protease family)